MNVKHTALGSLLAVAILQQGCLAYRVATAPVRYGVHRAEIARAERRGERRGEKRGEEKAEARPAPPQHIDPPERPVDFPAN